jgi:hypothetical protein
MDTDELVTAMRLAIADATDFDERSGRPTATSTTTPTAR